MNPPNNILRQAHGPNHISGQRPVNAPINKPGSVQLKMAIAPQVKRQPVAPPVYRPQTTPKVLQGKLASGPQAHLQSHSLPRAAAPYRPQTTPKVLQGKLASGPQTHSHQSHLAPRAAVAYRPQTAPKVLQAKSACGHQAHSHQPQAHRSPPTPKCLQLRTAGRPQTPSTRSPHMNPLPGHLVQPRMATQGRHPFANSTPATHFTGSHAIQPMMSSDVIQQWPSWDEVKNYGYNALVSLQSIGGIATGIATALQAQGLGFGIPAIIGAAPAIFKLIIDRCSRENWSYQDDTAYTIGPIFGDLASQVASIGVPAIMAISEATEGSTLITMGVLTAILSTVSWIVMSKFTDKYDMWEKQLYNAVAACCRQRLGYEPV